MPKTQRSVHRNMMDMPPPGDVACNEDSREIFLFGVVNSSVAIQVVSALRELDTVKNQPITLVLASQGGEEGPGWAIYEAIKMCQNQVICLAIAECQSIAALIIQAADVRLMSPDCRFMTHNGTVGFSIDIGKLDAFTDEVKLLTQKYYGAIAERSGNDIKFIKSLGSQETFMSTTECLKYNLIDGIVGYKELRRQNIQATSKPSRTKKSKSKKGKK
jgi:ATP-dependent Clp protease protease subunit